MILKLVIPRLESDTYGVLHTVRVYHLIIDHHIRNVMAIIIPVRPVVLINHFQT